MGFILGQLDHKIFSVWQEYQIFLNLLRVILKRKPKIMLFRQSFKNSMSFKEVISPKVCDILDVGWFYATYRRIYLWCIHGCYRPMHADNLSYLHECCILHYWVFVRPSSEPCHYNVTHSFRNLKVTFCVLLKTCIVFIKGCQI